MVGINIFQLIHMYHLVSKVLKKRKVKSFSEIVNIVIERNSVFNLSVKNVIFAIKDHKPRITELLKSS